MDVDHKRPNYLVFQTNAAFEEYKHYPASENYAQAC
jgi:hypothetical protein